MDADKLKRALAWTGGISLGIGWIAGVAAIAMRPGSPEAALLLALSVLAPVPGVGAAAAFVCQMGLAPSWPAAWSERRLVASGAIAAVGGLLFIGAALALSYKLGEEYGRIAVAASVAPFAAALYAAHRAIARLSVRSSLASAGVFFGMTVLSMAAIVVLWPPLIMMTGKPISENLRVAIGSRRGDVAFFRWSDDSANDRTTTVDSFYRLKGRWLFAPDPPPAQLSVVTGRAWKVADGPDGLVYLRYLIEPSPGQPGENREYMLALEIPGALARTDAPMEIGQFEAMAASWKWGDTKRFTPMRISKGSLDLTAFGAGETRGRLTATFSGRELDAEGKLIKDSKPRELDADVTFHVGTRTFPDFRFTKTGEPFAAALTRMAGARKKLDTGPRP